MQRLFAIITRMLLTAAGLLLAACVSHEPRALLPAITLSPEQIEIRSSNAQRAGVDFGLRASINESDSLSNVVRLPGVRVRSVIANGAANRAGIREGDVILSVDSTETNDPDTLELLSRQATGTQFNFRLRRNTTVLETVVTAQLQTSGDAAMTELYRVDPLASRAGYQTELLEFNGQPAVAAARIVELLPDSPLPAHGFAVGDIITAVNGRRSGSAQSLIDTLLTEYEAGDTVRLSVYRNGSMREGELKLWDPGRRLSSISLWPLLRYESSLTPDQVSFSLVDLWLFSVYRYNRSEGEKRHSVFGLFTITSNLGELLEEPN
jgi:serine protease Do